MGAACSCSPFLLDEPLPSKGPLYVTLKKATVQTNENLDPGRPALGMNDVNVFSPQEEGKLWLFFESDECTSTCGQSVVKLRMAKPPKKTLGRVEIFSTEPVIKRFEEWQDSEGSDMCVDELLDFDSIPVKRTSTQNRIPIEAGLVWKIKRTAKFYDQEDKEFASMSFKLKGTARTSVEYENRMPVKEECRVKPKRARYSFSWPEFGKDVPINADNCCWHFWDHIFDMDQLTVRCCTETDGEVANISVNKNMPSAKSLLVGFTLAYYLHPARVAEEIPSRAHGMY